MKNLAIVFCFALILAKAGSLDAATVILNEDFEGASYVIGADPTAGSIPLVIDKRVHDATRATQGVYGVDATLKIVAPALAGFGTKTFEAEDLTFTNMFDFTITTPEWRDHSGGKGLQKGRIQFDFIPTLIADQGTYWYCEMNLFDNYDVATPPTRDDALVNIKNNNGTWRCRLSDVNGTFVNRDAPGAMVSGTAYRVTSEFDMTTRAVTMTLQGPLPDTAVIHTTTDYIYSQPTAPSPFTGVRGLHINLAVDDQGKFQLDNLIVTDLEEPVAGIGNWSEY